MHDIKKSLIADKATAKLDNAIKAIAEKADAKKGLKEPTIP